ncbi:hypothetical protein ACERK3_13770 [Phycisphaerales bacterium AB-hyl4]|uniref:Uncharacterized protein n=1 Tax=Natronomicrosphaera hydrolytica TaxID=3242702 RepID=A0ABV4U6Y4_9BACT
MDSHYHEAMPPIQNFDAGPLRKTLTKIGFNTRLARDVEDLLLFWHASFMTHPTLAPADETSLTESQLVEWERFYADKQQFARQLPSPITNADGEQLHLIDQVTALDDPAAFAPLQDFHASLAGRFLRQVCTPYMFWYGRTPWLDYTLACNRNEDALVRLLTIDATIWGMPRLQVCWPVLQHKKVNPPLYDTLWNAKQRRIRRTIERTDTGPMLKVATYRSKKTEFTARLQQVLADQGHDLDEPELRDIFDAFVQGFGFQSDPTLPERNDTHSQSLLRKRPEIEKS